MRWYAPILYLGASPTTWLGLAFAPLALLSRGGVQIVDGAIEIHSGIVTRLLRIGLPWIGPAMALTLGHVVLGGDRTCLDHTGAHERVHVRQYERWGPLFIPAYLLMALIVHLRRGNAYRDNPFEREAFERTQIT